MPPDEAANTPGGAPPAPAAPAPAAPAEAPAPEQPKSASEQLRERMQGKVRPIKQGGKLPTGLAVTPKSKAAAPAPPAPPEPPKEPAAPPPPPVAPPEPPKEPPKEDESKLALAHARALRTLEQRDAEIAQLRRGTESDARDAKHYRTLRERAKDPANLVEAIEEFSGRPLAEVIQGLYEGKIPAPKVRRADLPPELLTWKEETEAELARLKAREAEDQARQQFQEHVQQATAWITSNAEHLPYLAALDWVPSGIVHRARQSESTDAAKLALEMQEDIRANVVAILSDERARTHLLKSNEALRKTLRAELDKLDGKQPAQSNDSGQGAGNGSGASGARTSALGAASSEGSLPSLADMGEEERAQRAHDEFAKRMAERRQARRR